MAPARRQRKRKKRRKRKRKRGKEERSAGSAFSPAPGREGPVGTGARSRSARGETHRRSPSGSHRPPRHLPRPHTGLAKAGRVGEAERGVGGARQGRAEGPPRREEERERSRRRRETEEGHVRGCRGSVPPHTTGRARARRCGRVRAGVGCPPAPAGDKPLCRGLTFNRSQRGSCSATYETPTQKQVVYEWFSARFHTNVR